ncbi:hypothetical protein [Pantoea ananatis]|uniref:hypothetical protein n=1 Tax=Pantoea ananas TaxID=553 RepID=UPI001B30B6C2|nr:hypothetical protein [Pantoea ananatis]
MKEILKNKRSALIISIIISINFLSLIVILFGTKGSFIYEKTINLSIFITSTTFMLSPMLIFLPKKSKGDV